MRLEISTPALYILHQLYQHGYEGFIVGGAVRDLMMHVQPTDYDFTTNATPEQLQIVFPDSFYENEFGTVSITHEHLVEKLQLEEIETSTITSSPTKPRVIDVARATKLHESLQMTGTPAETGHAAVIVQ